MLPTRHSSLRCKNPTRIGLSFAVVILALTATGCSTTQEFKPTASVIVGAHKSL